MEKKNKLHLDKRQKIQRCCSLVSL